MNPPDEPKSGIKKSRRLRLRVTPPQEWEYIEGRPDWIPAVGNWASVVDRGRLRVKLPQGWRGQAEPGEPQTLGAPPLAAREPKRLLYAVWFRDCGTDTYLDLARALRFRVDRMASAEQVAKVRAIRYVKRGRALACSLGIWPWASWPNGNPPQSEWWNDDHCRTWLHNWIAHAQGQAALARTEATRAAVIEPQLLIRAALEQHLLAPAEISKRFRARLLGSVH